MKGPASVNEGETSTILLYIVSAVPTPPHRSNIVDADCQISFCGTEVRTFTPACVFITET